MAVLNAVIVPAKVLKDGRHKIRISVAHNGETRYLVTDIIVDSAKEFRNGSITKRPDATILNTKLRGLLQRYQQVIDELAYVNGLNCQELVFQLRNAGNEKLRTLKSIYEEYITYTRLSEGSKNSYSVLWRIVIKHLSPNILMNHITRLTILGLEKYLRDRKLKPASIRNCLLFVRTLINYAKRSGYVDYKVDPMAGYDMPPAEPRQAWLTAEEVKRIRDLKAPRPNIAKCRDYFMLSYYLGGINFVDLLKINFNEQTDTIKYVRTKTQNRMKVNKFVEFEIPEEAKEIINRYKDKNGFLSVTEAQRKSCGHSFFVTNMPIIAKLTGIKHVIYYSARKSFSQHAFDLNVNTSVIDYILGHSVDRKGSCLYAYVTVSPKHATEAIRKVLDNLK